MEKNTNKTTNWYTVHTYSGYEQKIEKIIRRMIETDPIFATVCHDVKVPFATTIEVKNGVKKEVKHKILPGYILVELDLPNDNSWKDYCTQVKRIQGVTGFLTSTRGEKPSPISFEEYRKILEATGEISSEKKVVPRQELSTGEKVKVVDGPFSGFAGSISEINADKSKVTVMVEIFGRPLPVELDFIQVEKTIE